MPPQSPINIDALRAALASQAQARTGPTAYPVNAMALRVSPNAALPSGAPNTPGIPSPSMPNPAQPGPTNVSQQPGPAQAAQAMAGAAQQASTAPVFDEETRNIAKALVTKLLKHI